MRKAAIILTAFALPMLGQIRFEEAATSAGIDFVLHNGEAGLFHQIELMLGGVAVFDYNNDGCLDIYFTNGAAPETLKKDSPKYHNRLYRGDCSMGFSDVTGDSGVAGEGYSMAVATADYDNDGNQDIYVAGVNRNILFRNRGDGTFEDVTKSAGLDGVDPKVGKLWSISAGWFDYDNDGWLDLFVSNYVRWDPLTEPRCGSAEVPLHCHPDNYTGLPHQLFHNNGDGTFEDATYSSGIGLHIGKGMGLAFADFNRDGFTDVFLANDSVRSLSLREPGRRRSDELGLSLAWPCPRRHGHCRHGRRFPGPRQRWPPRSS